DSVAGVSSGGRPGARPGSGVGAVGAGRAPGARGRDRRPPGVLPTLRGGADRGVGALRGGGRAADHRPHGEPAPERRGVPRRDPVRIGERPVFHHLDLRARHRPARGAPGRAGAAHTGRPPGALDRAPRDRAATVVVQPGPGGRPPVRRRQPHRDVGLGPVDGSASIARRHRRRERVDLRPARAPAAGAGRPASARRA
ncbi:MAG: Cobalt-zinc-cadmium resistance protein CzcA; Cation efflux system protein CusA, partial [uncultured Nocardioides sp.]